MNFRLQLVKGMILKKSRNCTFTLRYRVCLRNPRAKYCTQMVFVHHSRHGKHFSPPSRAIYITLAHSADTEGFQDNVQRAT
jgi:hypothetical protein